MILISTLLGIIACRYLVSGYNENRYIAAPEIAEHYNMNVRALMPALRQLVRAGILRSRVGGYTPGFIFAKDPATISLLDVIIALEGDNKFECCMELMPNLKCDNCDKHGCGVFHIIGEIHQQTQARLAAVSLVEHQCMAMEM